MKHNYMYIGLFEVDLGLDDMSPFTDPIELDDISADPDTSESLTSTNTSESPTSTDTSQFPTSNEDDG